MKEPGPRAPTTRGDSRPWRAGTARGASRVLLGSVLVLMAACGTDPEITGLAPQATGLQSEAAGLDRSAKTDAPVPMEDSEARDADIHRQGNNNSASRSRDAGSESLASKNLAEVHLDGIDVIPDPSLGATVPVLQLKVKEADFVQVLRCSGNFVLRTPTGERLTPGTQAPAEHLAWSWDRAVRSTEFCRFASMRSIFGQYADVSASDPRVFYVLNPCILNPETPENELTALCSHRLSISPIVTLPNPPLAPTPGTQSGLSDRLQRYAQTQAVVEGQLSLLHVLAVRSEKLFQVCQKNQKTTQQLNTFWTGMGKLATMAFTSVAPAAGGILSLPVIHQEVSTLLRGLFERKDSVSTACSQLDQTLEAARNASVRYEAALEDLKSQVQDLKETPNLAR